MIHFIELVIPIQHSWLTMLDRIALPVVQMLEKGTPIFFTNDQSTVMRLRIEEKAFDLHKNTVYTYLIECLQSDEKVEIYKQSYALEEARFGKVKNVKVHTEMFTAASDLMIRLLEEAEHLDVYENRLPYAVIATYFLLNKMNKKEAQDLCALYMRHWMYFNEQDEYEALLKFFEETYAEEAISIQKLIVNINENETLTALFDNWNQSSSTFMESCSKPQIRLEMNHRHKTYYYLENNLENARVWEIIADHIHLLYNRFGIENEDETLLIYLTQQAMRLA